jgi:inositol 1,4,5-triphosphate receptor type 1
MIKDNDDIMRDILKFYSDHTSRIEIIKEGTSSPLFFPILPYCQFSSEAPKEKFKRECNRTNAKTKCESLMSESKLLITDLRVNYWLRTGLTRFVGILQQYLDMLRSILSYLCILLNFIILFSYTNEVGTRTDDPELFNSSVLFTQILLFSVGIITFMLVFIVFMNSLINKIPIKIMRYKVLQEERDKQITFQNKIQTYAYSDVTVTRIRKVISITYSILTDLQLLYFFALTILTILGIVYHPFFYTYLLTYPILRSPSLMSVLQAVWYPRKILFLTFVLMLMVIYALTVFSFWAYADEYNQND